MDINFENLYEAIQNEFLIDTKFQVQMEDFTTSSPRDKTSKIFHANNMSGNRQSISKMVNATSTVSPFETSNYPSETKIHLLPLAKISALVYRQINVIFDPTQAMYLQVGPK